jgi:O-antigen/teichoic acid export membrane protein
MPGLRPRADVRISARTVIGVADQAASSAGNFLFVVLVARVASLEEFGSFSVGLAAAMLLLALSRAFLGTPLLVGDAVDGSHARRLGDALLVALCVGAVGALVVGLVSTTSSGSRAIAALLGAGAVTAIVQDVCRHGASAVGRPQWALAVDVLWLAVIAAALLADVTGAVSVDGRTAIACWVIGGLLSTVVALGVVQPVFSPRGLRRRMRRSGRLRSHLTVTVAAPQGAMLVVLAVMASELGEDAVAAVRGAGTLMGPVNLLFAALTFAALPELVRRDAGRGGPARAQDAVRIGLGLLCAVGVWSGLLLLLPPGAGGELLGESWAAARSVLLLTTAEYLFAAAAAAAGTVLQARGQAHLHALGRLVHAGGVLVLGLGLVTAGVDIGVVAAAFALSAGVAAAVSWAFLLRGAVLAPTPRPAEGARRAAGGQEASARDG